MCSDNKTIPTLPNESKINPIILAAIMTIPLIIGTIIASLICKFGSTEKYLSAINIIAEYDAGWLYLALIIFGRTIWFLNIFPTKKYKHEVKGGMRANPFFYKAIGKNAPEDVLVVLEDEGVLGQFNRANRSVHNMIELFGGFVASLFAAGVVFPFPTLVCVCIFCMGRILHQSGYSSGYGSHMKGFMMSMMSISTVEGMLAVVAMTAIKS